MTYVLDELATEARSVRLDMPESYAVARSQIPKMRISTRIILAPWPPSPTAIPCFLDT